MTAPWPREGYVHGGGRGEIALIALARVELPDPLPISRSRHGMPDGGDGPGSVSLVPRLRATDPAWFADNVLAPFADMIAEDLGGSAAEAARAAERAYVIEAALDDPDDLGHIQAAWAIAKCICEEGASIVIDVFAARAHLGSEVAALPPERGFDLMHEVTLLFDERPDGTVAAWTAGMRKFGRPDLVVLGVGDQTETALALRDAAALLASGELAGAPADDGDLPIDGPAVVLTSKP